MVTLCSAWPFSMSDFSDSVAVGQACTQAPQETHSESMKDSSWLAATLDSKPRPWMVSAKRALLLVAGAHAARADDALARVESEIGIRLVLLGIQVILALVAVAHLAQADDAGHVLQLAVAVRGAGEAIERMIRDVQLHHAAADVGELLVLGVTTMPCATGVVHEAGKPFMPSICTRHMRHEPNASSCLRGAELRNLDVRERRGAHHRSALGHRDLAAVDGQGNELLARPLRGAVIVLDNG